MSIKHVLRLQSYDYTQQLQYNQYIVYIPIFDTLNSLGTLKPDIDKALNLAKLLKII